MNRAVSTYSNSDREPIEGLSTLDTEVRKYKKKSVNRPSMEKGTASGVDTVVSGYRPDAGGYLAKLATKFKPTGANAIATMRTMGAPKPAGDPTQNWNS